MIVAGLSAISVGVIYKYWLILALLAIFVGSATLLSLLWVTSRLFNDYPFERLLMFCGSLTGTITTGIALVRIVDPELRTPATADYFYASGLAFFLAIPLILILNLPAATIASGTTAGYWVTAAVLVAYGLVLLLVFRILAGSRSFVRSDMT